MEQDIEGSQILLLFSCAILSLFAFGIMRAWLVLRSYFKAAHHLPFIAAGRTNAKAILFGVALVISITMTHDATAAFKIGTDNTHLKIGGLLQGWITLDEDKAPDGDSWENEYYLRRMRLMFYGQISKWVNFFIETDNPNFGKGGDVSMNMFIQDAYLEINLHEMIQIDGGMILVPFSHHGMQGATSLLAIDYHTSHVRYPAGSNKVWRDYGAMVKGIFFQKWLEYRIGIFNGVHGKAAEIRKDAVDIDGDGTVEDIWWKESSDPRNGSDCPRLVARLTFNIFEPEGGAGAGGMFYDGIYLKMTDKGLVSSKKVLSIGGSIDWQKDLNIVLNDLPSLQERATATATAKSQGADTALLSRTTRSSSDYIGAAGDLFFDIPLGSNKLMSINGQADFFYYNYGDRSDPNAYYNTSQDTKSFTGYGIMSELGFRYDRYQPLVIVDWYESEGGYTTNPMSGESKHSADLGDLFGIYGGFNYWLFGHSTSFKIQFGANKANGAQDWNMSGRFQAQLLF